MKRRRFGLLGGTGLAALKFGVGRAKAADASLLTTTLTPFGAERAGNADGSIPAWTGGYTRLPAGWQSGDFMPLPDAWASEQPVVVVDSSNMAQHADRLTEGVAAMMTKYGLSIKVFPTHRSSAAPQSVYDAIANNVTTAKLSHPDDPRLGFEGAFGGVPFPIPDTDNKLAAGAQIMANHLTRWLGYAWYCHVASYVVDGGSAVLSAGAKFWCKYPYYIATSLANFDGRINVEFTINDSPANLVGEEVITQGYTNFIQQENETWQLLNGQGRVRKSPEVAFDTPSSFADGLVNYDEYGVFNGSMEKYDWRLLEKKEMYIPYHNNEMFVLTAQQAHQPHFLDPDAVRWELHRVWVIEATLHQGERNTLARRRFYVDEDTWTASLADVYDENNALYRVSFHYIMLRPDLPGTVTAGGSTLTIYNLQANSYVSIGGEWNSKLHPTLRFYPNLSDTMFDPQAMAASAQY